MLLSKLEFASFLTYSPRGKDPFIDKSRDVMNFLKQDSIVTKRNIPMSELIAESIKNELVNLPFKDFFGPHVYLIPVPKSSLIKEGTLWVPKNLVYAFSKQGLGNPLICLERVEAVRKSSFSSPKDRPKPSDHFRTIQIKHGLKIIENVKEIILVDDIVTRGSTLLGAASRLRQAFPNAHIRAFAVVRTISNPAEFSKIQYPCIGNIELKTNGETFRNP